VPHVVQPTTEDQAWQVSVASNQSIFREVNERLEKLNRDLSEIITTGDFVCECADTDCLERVGLTIAEYERLRSIPTRFAVRHGHIVQEAQHVVEQHIGYTVVETFGAAADYAESANPRTDDRFAHKLVSSSAIKSGRTPGLLSEPSRSDPAHRPVPLMDHPPCGMARAGRSRASPDGLSPVAEGLKGLAVKGPPGFEPGTKEL
jgi:hypothetical protein